MASITIDGQEYDLENLSDNARAQLSSIQVADQELNQVNARIALTQTARNAYAKSLSEQLPNPVSEDADAVVTIDNRPYSLSDFSDSAKAELASLQVADQKLSATSIRSCNGTNCSKCLRGGFKSCS